LAGQGHLEEGIVELRQGLDAYQDTGAQVFRPFALAYLAESLGRAGQVDEGLAVLEDTLATIEDTEERFWEVEVYRLKGELLLAQNASEAEVEGCFFRAIDVARRQQAKLLELRATVSLCRLWQARGKPAEALQMLAGIYNWFSEGFETADLKEAQALLEELGKD
jgi:predicted ATPase